MTATIPAANAAQTLSFRGPEVCRITGITYRQLDYWCRTNLLVPSITEACGSGTQRRYNRHDVDKVALTATLLNRGMSLQRIRGVLDHVTEHSTGFLIIDDHNVEVADDPERVAELLEWGGVFVTVVRIDAVRAQVSEAIATYADNSHRRKEPPAWATRSG